MRSARSPARRAIPATCSTEEMLHLKVVFAGRPHARIRQIDTAAALAMPGVVAVLTAADVPFNAFGLIEHDQPVLCRRRRPLRGRQGRARRRRVRGRGQRSAQPGGGRLRRSAGRDRSPRWRSRPTRRSSTRRAARTCSPAFPIRKGDVAAGFAAADVVLEGEFRPPGRSTPSCNPRPGIAFIDDAGRVVVETAGQWLHEDRKQIAQMLGCPRTRSSFATPRSAARSAGAKISRCSICSPWPPGSCDGRSASSGAAKNRSSATTSGTRIRIDCRWGATRGRQDHRRRSRTCWPTAAPTPRPAPR